MMLIYVAGTTCSNYIFADKGGKSFSVEKQVPGNTFAELDALVNKQKDRNPNIKDINNALDAYVQKYAQPDRSKPISEFMESFYKVFPKAKNELITLVLDKDTWQIAKGKKNPGDGLEKYIKNKFKETRNYLFH